METLNSNETSGHMEGTLTNNWLLNDSEIEGTIIVSVWCTSLVFECTTLYTILKSKPNLVRAEYLILLTLVISWIGFKTIVIINYVNNFFSANIYGRFGEFLAQWLFSNISFWTSMILAYYSVYHVSALNRSSLFRKIFELVHCAKTLIIYSIVVLAYSISFTTVTLLTNYRLAHINQTGNVNFTVYAAYESIRVKIMHMVILESLLPPLLPSLIYFVGVIIICNSWTRMHRFCHTAYAMKNIEIKRLRRNFILVIKFLVFSFCILFFIVCQFVDYMLFITDDYMAFVRYVGYLGDLIMMSFPFYLVLIHKILFNTLGKSMRRVFSLKSSVKSF